MRSAEIAAVIGAGTVSMAVALGGAFDPWERVIVGVLMAVVAVVLGLGLRGLPRREELVALAFVGWAAGSAVCRPTYPLAAKEMVTGWLVAWIVWVAVRRLDRARGHLVGWLMAAAAVVVAVTVLGEAVGAGMLRSGGLFVNPNVAAALLVPTVPGVWLLFGPRSNTRWLWLVVPSVVAGAVLTGSRAGLLALLVVVAVLLPRGRARRIGVALAALAAVVFLVWRFTASPDSLAWHRLEIWRALVPLVLEHPLVGVGSGWLEESTGVVRIAHDGGIARYGHIIGSAESSYFGVLVRTGIVGLGLLVTAFMLWWRRAPERARSGAALAVVAGVAVLALFHDFLDVDVVLWWWAVWLGLAVPVVTTTSDDIEEPTNWRAPVALAAALAVGFVVLWGVARPAYARWVWWQEIPDDEVAVRAMRAEPWLSEPAEWVVRNRLAAPSWNWETVAEILVWSRRAVTVHPGSARIWSEDAKVGARIANDFGPWPDALERARNGFERAVELEPHLPWYPLQWASFERSVGHTDEARELARRAVTNEPNFVRGWLFLARMDLDDGDVGSARLAYQRAADAAALAATKLLTRYERDLLRAPRWQVDEIAADLGEAAVEVGQ